jgi:peptidoglycan-N-acetylglucosamine deacetylase
MKDFQAMISNPVPWPNGAKCACSVTFDMDSDSLIHLEHPTDGYKRASAISMLQYGPTVAIPRIVETHRRLGIKQTFFIPSWCMETYPETVEIILQGGHEIGQHGYLHENPVSQSREEQAGWMDKSLEVIERMTGAKPRGWRAPLYNFSNDSADLLVERGFKYDASLMADDVPYVIDAKKGSLIELPTHWGLDDWPQYVQSMDLDYMMPIRSPETGWAPFVQEFEAAYRHGGLWIPVVHPFATGRLARWEVVANFLASVMERGDVWFAPMEDIAAHVEKVIADGTYTPRRVAMPQYHGPVAATL